ncbi:MAG: hypothetical protein IKP51_03955 [Treponema sp.]|nr:hypothetical protein [Treponema sp.]
MIEGEFTKKSGYAKSAYGFVFGYSDLANGYLKDYIRFEINTDGEYALYTWDGKTYKDLVQPNNKGTAYFYSHPAIKSGYNTQNKLKLVADDETQTWSVYLNGELIKDNIPYLKNGTHGVMGFFSVGQEEQENMPAVPVVVSYRITDAVLYNDGSEEY